MTETNKTQGLLATLRDALQQLASTLDHAREDVGAITSHVGRLQEGVEALCDLWQRENTSVGVDMLVDSAADLLAAFRALDSGILDAQADVDALEEAMADDDGRDA